jgi:hypothetical protein
MKRPLEFLKKASFKEKISRQLPVNGWFTLEAVIQRSTVMAGHRPTPDRDAIFQFFRKADVHRKKLLKGWWLEFTLLV